MSELVVSLSAVKKQAIDAEAAWQDLRNRTLKRLGPNDLLFDCAFCARACIVRNHPPRALWFCPCSPRNGQRAIGRAA